MKATFICWRCKDKSKRLTFKELKERKESYMETEYPLDYIKEEHYDYVCPKCEAVIICSERRLK